MHGSLNPSKTCNRSLNRSLIALNIEFCVVVAWIPRYYTQKEDIFRVYRVAFWGFFGWMYNSRYNYANRMRRRFTISQLGTPRHAFLTELTMRDSIDPRTYKVKDHGMTK